MGFHLNFTAWTLFWQYDDLLKHIIWFRQFILTGHGDLISRLPAPCSTIWYPLIVPTISVANFWYAGLSSPQIVGHFAEKSSYTCIISGVAPISQEEVYKDLWAVYCGCNIHHITNRQDFSQKNTSNISLLYLTVCSGTIN